jgi:predicted nucleic acid-binding Zn ribbon protein
LKREHNATIGDAMKEYFGKNGLQRRVQQATVVNEWPSLVGARLAKVTSPVSVDAAGTLWVRVSSPSWMQELHMMSREIIRELAKNGKPVKQIRWVANDVRVPTGLTSTERRPSRRRSPNG